MHFSRCSFSDYFFNFKFYLLPHLLVDFVFPAPYRPKFHAESRDREIIDNLSLLHPLLGISKFCVGHFISRSDFSDPKKGSKYKKVKISLCQALEALSEVLHLEEQLNPSITEGGDRISLKASIFGFAPAG
jgi:hypothetical protein